MAKKDKKQKKQEELDTETTIADMNVDGFKWYNPSKKDEKKTVHKISRKEYWQMVRGAFAAYAPYIIILLLSLILSFLLIKLWLS
jgi:hypothetical protein